MRQLRGKRTEYRDFWALRDVDLRVKHGEFVGLIGRNGAGKSTLLKVIARALTPTAGRMYVRGNVAPIIELGAGFHPELTGRENVYINGTMLGYSNAEMRRKFERIVEFSELAAFIDSPIRTYSTGMIARLGFAIAADVEPDILIVDEVLAVGDEEFQKKCLARMHEIRDNGATILFVTHAVDTMRDLADRAVLVENGHLVCSGSVDEVIDAYRNLQTHG